MAVDYIAQHAFYIAKAVLSIGGSEYNGSSYLEIAYPEVAKKDERTAEQIKQDLIKRLIG